MTIRSCLVIYENIINLQDFCQTTWNFAKPLHGAAKRLQNSHQTTSTVTLPHVAMIKSGLVRVLKWFGQYKMIILWNVTFFLTHLVMVESII